MKKIFSLLRMKQYVKNAFVFLPLFFSLNVIHVDKVIITLIAFILFSLVASSIYIINDIVDIEQDKMHPKKCLRPIASGEIVTKNAVIISIILALMGFLVSFFLNKTLFYIILTYYLMNLLYSLKLKNIPILDVFIIAFGFLLRIIAGAAVIGVKPTDWIIILTFLLALFLGLSKRYDDVLNSKNNLITRKNIIHYNEYFLSAATSMVGAVVIIAYIMYTISPEVTTRFSNTHLYVTSLFVVFAMIRYLQLIFVHNDVNSCPTEILYTDKYIILSIFFWICSFVLLIYC